MAQTILVVEDDHHINQVVSEYLKEAGYIVLSAFGGGSAAHMLAHDKEISLFVLDIMLPEISGLELLGAIRRDDSHREKPVVMLTALGDEATQLLSFEELADDYITKPFSPKILVKRVEALLRRSGSAGNILQCGEITVDNDSYEAWETGRKLKLTLREFELLRALAVNARKVLTRQQLLNYAWGYDYFGDERIVDVHIKNLRKKLRTDCISTIKGVGYKLDTDSGEAT